MRSGGQYAYGSRLKDDSASRAKTYDNNTCKVHRVIQIPSPLVAGPGAAAGKGERWWKTGATSWSW